MVYSQHYQTKRTPQRMQTPGRPEQVKNNAGGFTWEVDDWTRLARFLVLGSEGGSYYVDERELTVRNAKAVARCIKEDGELVVRMAVSVSEGGRAANNDPALFVLAMAASPDFADAKTRRAALDNFHKAARIGTHWFHFANEVDNLRGWGRGLREAIAGLYIGDVDRLAYQCVKYQQRDGWSHRDLLRLSHPVPPTKAHNRLFEWITQGKARKAAPALVHAYEAAKVATSVKQVTALIEEHNLTREMIPTKWLNEVEVWAHLLMKMPMTAMIRNLGKMTSVGLLAPMTPAAKLVQMRLAEKDLLRKARVHPLNVLIALKTYSQGHGMRGKLSWEPVAQVVDALDEAFYLAFGNVEPMGKRTMLAIDVSGSMGHMINNMPLSCREAAAAMAMVTARAEEDWMAVAFTAAGPNAMKAAAQQRTTWGMYSSANNGISTLNISPRQRMDDVVRTVYNRSFGATDCALPMVYALQNKLDIDVFINYTDNETWAGSIHPHQALRQYREKTGIPAKLISVAMAGGGFSVADPEDSGQLDVVGFDTASPGVIANFARG